MRTTAPRDRRPPDPASRGGRVVAALLAAALLSAVSCGPGDPRKAGRLPLGFVDAPSPGQTLAGPVKVVGWAVAENGIRDVLVYVDGRLFASGTTGKGRDDVGRALPRFPDASSSGFEIPFDTAALSAGPHDLVVQARSESGAVRDIAAFSVTVAE